MPAYVNLTPGDPGPWFRQRTKANPSFAFDTMGGRYVVLCFFASATTPEMQRALELIFRQKQIFDDDKASFFGVSLDPGDETQNRVADRYPGYRFLWDFDGSVSRLYGALPRDSDPGAMIVDGVIKGVRHLWVVLDPTLRVLKVAPFRTDEAAVLELLAHLEQLPAPTCFPGFEVHAPVVVLPNVFEPAFCRMLIDLYEKHGGQETGFMQDVGGKTVQLHDHVHKRRRDYIIEDPQVIRAIRARFSRRVVPEIRKVHQFNATRMERFLVACYAAEDGGHFRAHRDNTTKGTAHRRFAASVNLNEDFEGGEVSFPEYGPRGFKPPAGGAVIFSCSLLHAVSKITKGRRFAFLPFLYDDAAAELRRANAKFLASELQASDACPTSERDEEREERAARSTVGAQDESV